MILQLKTLTPKLIDKIEGDLQWQTVKAAKAQVNAISAMVLEHMPMVSARARDAEGREGVRCVMVLAKASA